jgi:hypothetical protein
MSKYLTRSRLVHPWGHRNCMASQNFLTTFARQLNRNSNWGNALLRLPYRGAFAIHLTTISKRAIKVGSLALVDAQMMVRLSLFAHVYKPTPHRTILTGLQWLL